MASIAEVKTLRSLTLAKTRNVDNEGIKSLTALKDLESLTVTSLAISDDVISSLAELQGLQVLDISGNPDLYGRGFKELAAKGAFKHLRELQCGGTKFGTYGLEKMELLPKLEVLRAGGCEAVGVAVNGLTACDQLKVLDLSRNTMTDGNIKGINRLKNLEELSLADMPLTDEIFDSIKSMKKLKVLNVQGTRVSEPAVKLLKEKFLKDTEIHALQQKY
jgi:Leucine-rich repeat (LRR) protein